MVRAGARADADADARCLSLIRGVQGNAARAGWQPFSRYLPGRDELIVACRLAPRRRRRRCSVGRDAAADPGCVDVA